MSRLRIFAETDATQPLFCATDGGAIAARLAQAGVRFERWQTDSTVAAGADPSAVIDAYRADIDRLITAEGYQSFDVVSMSPGHPDAAAMRAKFLAEHTHAEDEVRFFVAGCGLFTLHIGTEVLEILCEQGDLIGVPAHTRHWFDMGPTPEFMAIRLFNNPAGWVAQFTGDDIADHFPRFDS